MNYIEIDFNEVKGYTKLSEKTKKLFKDTYKKHNTIQGADYKKDWVPVEVKDCGDYLKVTFRNGEWLHYTLSGEWY